MRRRLVRLGLLVAALAAAGPARAVPRISVGPVAGRGGTALAWHVQAELCHAYACVPWSRVSAAGAPDGAKARRLGVAGVLTGRVERRGRQRVLALSLFTGARLAARTWRLPLSAAGTLDDEALSGVVRGLAMHLDAPASPRALAAPEPPRAQPPPAAAPAPSAAPSSPPDTAPRTSAAEAPAAASPRPPPPAPAPLAAPPAPAPARRAAKRAPWLTAELGAFGARRELRFEQAAAAPAPLREHTAPAVLGPHLHVEVRPAAPFAGPAAAGARLFARYRTSIGLETAFEGAAPRPTSLSRLGLGASWRSPPLGALRLTLAPALSWESLTLAVDPAIPGLPDARLSGVKGALGVEIPLGRAASLLVSGGYVRWTTARELVSGEGAFFRGGSADALEAEAGVSLAIAGPVSAVLAAEYGGTRYALERDPSGLHAATAATDRHLGGRLALRARM